MAKFGMAGPGGTPDALKDFVASELAKWGPMARKAAEHRVLRFSEFTRQPRG